MRNINDSETEFLARVKLVRTSNVFTLAFDSSISINNFIETIKNNAFNNFGISRQEYDIEVVISGQYGNGAPEDAPAITYSEPDITVQRFFGKNLWSQAYYVRMIRLPQSEIVPDIPQSEIVPDIPQPYSADLSDVTNNLVNETNETNELNESN